uniref:hypothetical protein n=1 Tax=Anaerococcus mediterraneensis TaxID=1870984 RepID=UPI0012FE961E|nr:hypothetical protein [Anaerococcus mediterraneensis]
MGWFIINKLLIVFLSILLVGCAKDETYKKQDIKIRPSSKMTIKEEVPINMDCQVLEDTEIYADMDDKTAFDILEKGSIVRVILSEDKGFVYVNFLGQNFYIKKDKLKSL